MKQLTTLCSFIFLFAAIPLAAEQSSPAIEQLMTTVDLNEGETKSATLSNGRAVTVKLLRLEEERDGLRGAVRRADVEVEVDGERVTVASGMYHLPMRVGSVQIDCAVTKGFVASSSGDNPWALDADARLRLWPAESPWIRPGTFGIPAIMRWFSSDTQMTNDPCYVNACDLPGLASVYYHYGLDFGGAEGLVEVVAATDGVVVSVGQQIDQPEKHPKTVRPRYDVVYLRDDRGWYYRYSHLFAIDPGVQVGKRLKMSERIGLLGKEGGSGGWSHLHFDIQGPQPSGRYGIIDAYAFAFQAYQQTHPEPLVAVARPHQVAWLGDEVTLDASRSWSSRGAGAIQKYEWTLSDGTTAIGAKVSQRYDRSGHYSEIVKVTDDQGNVDYDFAVVQIFDPRTASKPTTPAIHAAYWPTFAIRPGDEITFKARTFNVDPQEGEEIWDFGDGHSAETQSDGNVNKLAKDGYAVTHHRYEKPGRYLVKVFRTNSRNETATTHLDVIVAAE